MTVVFDLEEIDSNRDINIIELLANFTKQKTRYTATGFTKPDLAVYLRENGVIGMGRM